MLAKIRDAAERSVQALESGARLSAVERTCASAVRFEARAYSGKRPDVIVVAHRGQGSPSDLARLDNAMSTAGGGVPGDDRGGICLLYTSPSPRDKRQSRMPSSA